MLSLQNYWKPLRLSLLAITCGGVLFVTLKSILVPATKPSPSPFEFPQSVPLTNWQAVESSPLQVSQDSNILAARLYRYQKNGLPLEIEMRYVVNTNGSVEGMMRGHSILKSSPGKLTVDQIEGVGYHGFLVRENRVYLNTCINPRGGSTVTDEQFRYNRNTYDIELGRLLPWLVGQASLQDVRCLWTQMSIPLQQETPKDAEKMLETAWVSWHRWWQPRFPKP